MWQDQVIGAMNIVFMIALIPTIFHPTQKPTFLTCLSTATAIFIIALVFVTVGFWYVAIANGIVTAQWYLLAWQRHQLNHGRSIWPRMSKLTEQVFNLD